MTPSFDFLIAGSGFGGSLLGLILTQLGYRVVIVDRATHPRFAIGESSTPLADATLRELCLRYQLPELLSLSAYGSAKRHLPHLTIGLKRGFSYFRHHPHEEFGQGRNRLEQLLVAASTEDETSDTHWLRSDVDAHFVKQVRAANIPLFEATEIQSVTPGTSNWSIALAQSGKAFTLEAKFLIDASGRGGAIAQQVVANPIALSPGTDPQPYEFLTNSRSLFGHFTGLKPWGMVLQDLRIPTAQHPFPCERAAVHHWIDQGWMWQLGFDNGVTSVGFCLQHDAYEEISRGSPAAQFHSLIQRYPSLAAQFAEAQLVAPDTGIQGTGRMQFLRSRFRGPNWVCLPAAAGFVDPLHSTGISHTVHAVRALAGAFENFRLDSSGLEAELERYAQHLRNEITLIDQLVYACYAAWEDFDANVAATMLYFAAATYVEQGVTANGFLNASDPGFRLCVAQVIDAIRTCQQKSQSWASLPGIIRRLIAPYNLVGLCDDSQNNLYRHTAATKA